MRFLFEPLQQRSDLGSAIAGDLRATWALVVGKPRQRNTYPGLPAVRNRRKYRDRIFLTLYRFNI